MKQFKQIILTGIFMFCFAFVLLVHGQKRPHNTKDRPAKGKPAPASIAISPQQKNFQQITAAANVSFTFPKGFKEVKAPDNEDLSFDYAMELPGKEFEIWFQVKSQKENYASYLKTIGNRSTMQDNPDSLYLKMGTAQALSLAGGNNFLTRYIPPHIAARYNADAGKSYFMYLPDAAMTRHYKYALLITLQKDHIGTILAVCLANEKGPEFFKNIDKANNCIKFKP